MRALNTPLSINLDAIVQIHLHDALYAFLFSDKRTTARSNDSTIRLEARTCSNARCTDSDLMPF